MKTEKSQPSGLFKEARSLSSKALLCIGAANLLVMGGFASLLLWAPAQIIPAAALGTVGFGAAGLRMIALSRPVKKEYPAKQKTIPEVKKEQLSLKPAAVPKAYQERINQLESCVKELKSREEGLNEFLDSFFGQSDLSKSRYISLITQTSQLLETNLNKARQAVKVFGSAPVSIERMELQDRYVENSKDLQSKVEDVFNALAAADQKSGLKAQSRLEGSLEELAAATALYTGKD